MNLSELSKFTTQKPLVVPPTAPEHPPSPSRQVLPFATTLDSNKPPKVVVYESSSQRETKPTSPNQPIDTQPRQSLTPLPVPSPFNILPFYRDPMMTFPKFPLKPLTNTHRFTPSTAIQKQRKTFPSSNTTLNSVVNNVMHIFTPRPYMQTTMIPIVTNFVNQYLQTFQLVQKQGDQLICIDLLNPQESTNSTTIWRNHPILIKYTVKKVCQVHISIKNKTTGRLMCFSEFRIHSRGANVTKMTSYATLGRNEMTIYLHRVSGVFKGVAKECIMNVGLVDVNLLTIVGQVPSQGFLIVKKPKKESLASGQVPEISETSQITRCQEINSSRVDIPKIRFDLVQPNDIMEEEVEDQYSTRLDLLVDETDEEEVATNQLQTNASVIDQSHQNIPDPTRRIPKIKDMEWVEIDDELFIYMHVIRRENQ